MNAAHGTTGPLVSLLAGTHELADIVARVHALAAEAVGAHRTVLLEFEAGTRRLRATSATGFQDLPGGTWLSDPADVGLVGAVLDGGRPAACRPLHEASPGLARRLDTPAAILAPVVAGGAPVGLLVLGCDRLLPAPAWSEAVMECAGAFGLAISRARTERDSALQRDLEALVVALGREAAPGLPVERLNDFCQAVAGLFAADTVRLWVHEREARRLTLLAGSERGRRARQLAVATSDAGHPAAAAMRAPRAALLAPPADGGAAPLATAAVPLRGRRRALGTLVLEGIRIAPGDEAWSLQRLDDLGRHLANLLEGAQLIGEVVRTKQELQNTFDSMQDLVFVRTREGRVAHTNAAAARRLNLSRDALVSHPVTEFVGEPLAAWLGEDAAGGPSPGRPRSAELQDAVLDGIFRVTVTPLFNSDRAWAGLVLVAHDVSEERRLEAERAALRERLAQSETLSHLVAGIAHELNNPLQGVLGHLELLRRTERLSPKATTAVRQILSRVGPGGAHRPQPPAARGIGPRRAPAGERQRGGAAGADLARGGVPARRHHDRATPRGASASRGGRCPAHPAGHSQHLRQRRAGDVRHGRAHRGPHVAGEEAPPGGGGDSRLWKRHIARRAAAGLRTVLHDQGCRQRARPGDGRRIVREHDGDIEAANHPGGGARFTLRFPAARMVK